MKFREFLLSTPSPARILAGIILGCGVVAGIVIYLRADVLLTPAAGVLEAPALGVVFAAWALGLGFIYADAQKRGMPPVLWTIVAAVVPNLLGFLLYFVMRQPPSQPCSHCGQMIKAGQRFCSWCGQMETAAPGQPPVHPETKPGPIA